MAETHRLVYLVDADELCEYEKGVYRRGVEKALARHAELIESSAKNQFINEVIGKTKRRARPVKVSDFDAEPFLVNVRNGVLDLRTGRLTNHSPAMLFLNQMDVEYDPTARAREFERFMESILPDPADRLRVIDHFASCLVRMPVKKDLMCVGETDSGKSTLLNLVRLFLGPENVSSTALQELEMDRFAAADLFGKLANIHPDIDDQELRRTSKFKTTSGSDQIRAQRKYGHPFFFVPYAKHLYSANRIPATKDESEAFFNRWNVIFFPMRFVDRPESYPGEHFSKRDPRILNRLLTPEEKSGILNVLAARARWVATAGEIPNSQSIDEVRDLWLYHSDFIENFLRDNIELNAEGRITKADPYHLYVGYCATRKITPKSKQEFNARIEKRGARESVGKVDGRSVKLWIGVRLKENDAANPVESVEPERPSTKSTEKRLLLVSELPDVSLLAAAEMISKAEWSS